MAYGQVDTGVIMAAGQPTVQPINPMDAAGQAMSLQQLQQNIKLKQQEVQQNAMSMRDQQELMRAYQVPDNIDPATGLLKPAAIQGISNPQMKQKLIQGYNDAQYQIEQRKNLASKEAIANNKLRMETEKDMREKAQSVYDATLQSTGDQNAATKAFMDAQKDGIKDLKANGVFPENYQFKMLDPKANATSLQTYKERQEAIDKHNKEQRDERHQKFEEGIQGANLSLARSREARESQKDAETAAAKKEGQMSDEDFKFGAQQYLAGDKSVMSSLGYGNTGSVNRAKMRTAIRAEATARGMSPQDVATALAEFGGLQAGERKLGERSANIGMAVTAASKFADLALEASDKVPRTDVIPFNKILLAGEKATGSPEVVKFGAANNSFINAYARAVSPTGTPTVSDKDHARDILETGYSQGQYKAAIEQLQKEMKAEQASPAAVKKELRDLASGKPSMEAEKKDAATADLSVKAPNGKVYHFKDKDQADAFKKAAGM